MTIIVGLLRTFGGLILYWITLLAFGVKPAIAVAIAFVVLMAAAVLSPDRRFRQSG